VQFDRMVAYIENQKERCVDPGSGHCLNLAPNGNRCVFGAFIPDNHPALGEPYKISDSFETVEMFPELLGVAVPDTEDGMELTYHLQRVHDGPQYRETSTGGGLSETGYERLKRIAEYHDLEFEVPVSNEPDNVESCNY